MRRGVILSAVAASVLMSGNALAKNNFIFRYKGDFTTLVAAEPPSEVGFPLRFGQLSVSFDDNDKNGMAEPENLDAEGIQLSLPITNITGAPVSYFLTLLEHTADGSQFSLCAPYTLAAGETLVCKWGKSLSSSPTLSSAIMNGPGEEVSFPVEIEITSVRIGGGFSGEEIEIPESEKRRSEVWNFRVAE